MFELLEKLFTIPTAFAQKAGTAGEVASETQDQITGLVTFIVNQIPLWITAFIVLVASFVLARVVKNAVENKMTQEGFEEEHKEIQIVAGRTANAVVLLVGITVALKIAGLDLTPIIAAGAFGIGFALQDLIMNFLAGVMILSARHYSIGDVIKVNGTMGKIIEIQTRATVLKAFDGTKIVVPNADLFKNQVTSYTSNPFRRIQLVNGVAYGSDLRLTSQVVLEAVKNTPGVLAVPKPAVWFYEWGDYSINFKINAWVDTKGGWLKVRNQLMYNINSALEKAGIEIPYPIQTIYMGRDDENTNPGLESAIKETMQVKATVQNGVPKTYIATPVESVSPQAAQIMPINQQNSEIPVQAQSAVPSQSTVPTQSSIMNPENYDAPDWLKKAMDKNIVKPMEPAPMGVLTVNTNSQAEIAQPVFPVPAAFQQQPVVQQPVISETQPLGQQIAIMEQPSAPLQNIQAVQTPPVEQYTNAQNQMPVESIVQQPVETTVIIQNPQENQTLGQSQKPIDAQPDLSTLTI